MSAPEALKAARALICYATDIRLRAERRAGELLAEMAESGERDTGKGNRNPALKSLYATPKLADLGVTKTQSSRWQQLAKLPEAVFEKKVEAAKVKAENSTTSAPRHVRSKYTGEFEWYTPAEFIEAARAVLAEFDLDLAGDGIVEEAVLETFDDKSFKTIERFADLSAFGALERGFGFHVSHCATILSCP
jgi:hypothetical protein